MQRAWITIPLLLGAGAVALAGCGGEHEEPRDPVVDTTFGLGQVVPDFSFTTLEGDSHQLSDYADGSPLVVLMRDAACPVSRRYGPRSARLDEEFGAAGVRFLYINVSPLDTPEAMAEDAARYGLRAPYAPDRDWHAVRALHALTTTEAFVLDGERRLRYRGAIDDQYGIRFTKPEPRRHYLRTAVEAVLEGGTVRTPSTLAEGCYLAADVREIDHHHN